MNNKLWVWIGLGGAAVLGALYVSGVIGPKPVSLSLPAVTPVTEAPADAAPAAGDGADAADTAQAGQAGQAEAVAAPAADTPQTAAASADAPEAAPEVSEAAPSAPADAPEMAPQSVTEAAPAQDAEDAGTELEIASIETRAAAGEDTATAGETPGAAAPSFDLVRAEPGGLITVAGRAEPGSEVILLLDGAEELTSPVGSDGRFAAFFDLRPSATPQVLRLVMLWQGARIDSEQEVILTPPAPRVAEDGETPGEAAELAAAGPGDAGDTPAQAAPTVLLSDADGVEVMQSAEAVAPGGVAIDAITYDDEGGVALSGRGNGEAFLRVYLDNSEVTTLQVAADGRWQVALPQIAAGTYTLRVDQIDGKGEVTARAESPFRREAPEKLAAAAADLPSAEEIAAVTVQPGNTLWAIARERYGDGMAYVRLFEANKTQIRDPDLIYPGQIFAFPD